MWAPERSCVRSIVRSCNFCSRCHRGLGSAWRLGRSGLAGLRQERRKNFKKTRKISPDSGWIQPGFNLGSTSDSGWIQLGFNLDSISDSIWIRSRIQSGFDLGFNLDSMLDSNWKLQILGRGSSGLTCCYYGINTGTEGASTSNQD